MGYKNIPTPPCGPAFLPGGDSWLQPRGLQRGGLQSWRSSQFIFVHHPKPSFSNEIACCEFVSCRPHHSVRELVQVTQLREVVALRWCSYGSTSVWFRQLYMVRATAWLPTFLTFSSSQPWWSPAQISYENSYKIWIVINLYINLYIWS